MEASERVVEAYMRIVKKCLTITNVKCGNNKEIDILAVDSQNHRFHVEVTVSTSDMFAKITDKEMSSEKAKKKKAIFRRTMDFFVDQKFNNKDVLEGLSIYGFQGTNYKKVIVSWGATSLAYERAKQEGIEIWCLPELISELFKVTTRTGYFSDEERVFQLIGLWMKDKGLLEKSGKDNDAGIKKSSNRHHG